MDTALPQKFPFILDRNLAKAYCTGNRVCTSCDIVVLDIYIYIYIYKLMVKSIKPATAVRQECLCALDFLNPLKFYGHVKVCFGLKSNSSRVRI